MLVVVKHKRQARQNKIAADTDHPTITQLTVQILQNTVNSSDPTITQLTVQILQNKVNSSDPIGE